MINDSLHFDSMGVLRTVKYVLSYSYDKWFQSKGLLCEVGKFSMLKAFFNKSFNGLNFFSFLKVGNSPKEESEDSKRQSGSWRQAIFKTVVTPGKTIVPGNFLNYIQLCCCSFVHRNWKNWMIDVFLIEILDYKM